VTAPAVTLRVPGTPKPKGSMKCIGRSGKVRHQLTEDAGPELKTWRDRVTNTARQVHTTAEPREPVLIDVTFVLPRPQTHRAQRNGRTELAGPIRPRYATTPATSRRTGDIDKLARLILDALTDAGLLTDDAQVTDLTTRKTYVGDPNRDPLGYEGACITIAYPTRSTTP